LSIFRASLFSTTRSRYSPWSYDRLKLDIRELP
jgi:hypothetical protein